MEDNEGPKPMRYYRDSEKVRNAADQFSDHHSEYEARGQQNHDRIDSVHKHNATHPRLHEELEKRKSTTKVTAIKIKQRKLEKDICEVCKKLRKYKRVYRNTGLKRSKHNKSKKPRGQGREKKTRNRITYKRTTLRNTKAMKPKQKRTNRRQPYHKHSDITTDNICISRNEKRCSNLHTVGSYDDDKEFNSYAHHYRRSIHEGSWNSDGKHRSEVYIDTDSDVTIGSYKSNFSIDEEPMVS